MDADSSEFISGAPRGRARLSDPAAVVAQVYTRCTCQPVDDG